MPRKKASNKEAGGKQKQEKEVEEKVEAVVDGDKKEEEKKDEEPKKEEPTPFDDVKKTVNMLLDGVEKKDRLLLTRSLRSLTAIRRTLDGPLMTQVLNYYYPMKAPLPAESAANFFALYKAPDPSDAPKKAIAAPKQDEKEVKESMLEAKKKAKAAAVKKIKDEDEAKKQEEKDKKKSPEELVKEKEAEKKRLSEEVESKKRAEELKQRMIAEEAARRLRARELPEVQTYCHLLVLCLLLDNEQYPDALKCSDALYDFLQSHNRRTLDPLSAKIYQLHALTHERMGTLTSIRNELLVAYRSSCLQHNEPGQASLSCAILRSYLTDKLYKQADQFRLNSTFPESAQKSNYYHARYLYYVGQLEAMQLHYSDAFASLSQAVRKAPSGALGFRTTVYQLSFIVQMLIGEIPKRSSFFESSLEDALHPYFLLTQTVRVGDLSGFERCVAENRAQFTKDGVYALIMRLRNNVIKTGLRQINLAYSRISIADVQHRLNLPSVEDAEHVVAKAIHDGVIDAVIDRTNHFLFSRENSDMYNTNEPQSVFHKRIQFCNEVHNEAVQALRYPPNAHKSKADLDAERELRAEGEEIEAAMKEAEEDDEEE